MRLKKTVGRLATYLQAYGDLMVSTNGWDPAVLARFRADPLVAGFRGALDDNGDHRAARARRHAAPRRVARAARPPARRSSASASSTAQFDLGADGVILHGVAPADLTGVVEAYRRRA